MNIIVVNSNGTPLCITSKEHTDSFALEKKGQYRAEFLFQMNSMYKSDTTSYDMHIIENDGFDIIIMDKDEIVLELHFNNNKSIEMLSKYINIKNVYLEQSNQDLQSLLCSFPIIIKAKPKKISLNKEICKNLPRIYRYKYYLDANHAVYIEEELGDIHPHTWEFTIELKHINDEFIAFIDVENIVKEILEPYQGKYINEITPFTEINPTTENIGEYFKNYINGKIKEKNWKLLKIEISESPTRTYILKLE